MEAELLELRIVSHHEDFKDVRLVVLIDGSRLDAIDIRGVVELAVVHGVTFVVQVLLDDVHAVFGAFRHHVTGTLYTAFRRLVVLVPHAVDSLAIGALASTRHGLTLDVTVVALIDRHEDRGEDTGVVLLDLFVGDHALDHVASKEDLTCLEERGQLVDADTRSEYVKAVVEVLEAPARVLEQVHHDWQEGA